jgi:hypothetical protein
MRIACCISALALVVACGGPRPAQEQPPATPSSPAAASTTPGPPTPAPSTPAPTSRVEFPTAHGPLAVDVELDDTVAAGSAPSRVEVIGELPQRAIVLIDRYPSVPGGLSMCQAGEESFVRVVAIAGPPRVSFTAKIGSCLQNIELADPGLEWRSDTATLRIEWLASASGMPEVRQLRVMADGTVLRN